MKARNAVVGTLVAGGLLVGCNPGEPQKVSGLFDEVKYSAAKYKNVTRTVVDYQRQCTTKWRTVNKSSGIGKNKRTWTERESYQDCKNVRTGSHQVTDRVKTKSAKYCVELDHVKDGSTYHNDVWFNVSNSEYNKYSGLAEGAKVKSMEYNHKGC